MTKNEKKYNRLTMSIEKQEQICERETYVLPYYRRNEIVLSRINRIRSVFSGFENCGALLLVSRLRSVLIDLVDVELQHC